MHKFYTNQAGNKFVGQENIDPKLLEACEVALSSPAKSKTKKRDEGWTLSPEPGSNQNSPEALSLASELTIEASITKSRASRRGKIPFREVLEDSELRFGDLILGDEQFCGSVDVIEPAEDGEERAAAFADFFGN